MPSDANQTKNTCSTCIQWLHITAFTMKCCLQGVYERGMLSEGWGTPPPCYAASTPNTKGVHKTLALNATEPAQEVADVQLAHKACELWGEKNNYKEKFTAMHIVVFEMQSKDTVTKFSHVSNMNNVPSLVHDMN